MEKIYHETEEKSGNYASNSPCVSVRAFRPTGEEPGLPAIIILEAGKVNPNSGMLDFNYQKNILYDWHHDGAKLIRKAIKEYDTFKKKVYRLAEEGGE